MVSNSKSFTNSSFNCKNPYWNLAEDIAAGDGTTSVVVLAEVLLGQA